MSKARVDTIRRPVLFGDKEAEQVAYEIDAYHEAEGIVLEIESGRGHLGNALFRGLFDRRCSVPGRGHVAGVPVQERETRSQERGLYLGSLRGHAIYASGRLQLPSDGLLLFGY